MYTYHWIHILTLHVKTRCAIGGLNLVRRIIFVTFPVIVQHLFQSFCFKRRYSLDTYTKIGQNQERNNTLKIGGLFVSISISVTTIG